MKTERRAWLADLPKMLIGAKKFCACCRHLFIAEEPHQEFCWHCGDEEFWKLWRSI